MPIKPITGVWEYLPAMPGGTMSVKVPLHHLRQKLNSIAGYHLPAVRRRDAFYAKLEQQREASRA
ncbi:MAG: hypothetical protein M1823_000645 [Watsoniomyces obsoletus]|nr:MAG: hypothetical protein M1823_000645 [Watsoniomyces obsoletus]